MLASIATPPPAAAEEANRETLCRVMVGENGELRYADLPELRVLHGTEAQGRFAPELPGGATSITCGRTSVVPAPHDDEVLLLGIPFFIVDADEDRAGVLEIVNGRYRYRMLVGELQEEEIAALQARLNEFQTRLQDSAD